MALTIAEVVRSATRNKRLVVANVTFDSSYPTGGEALAPSAFGLVSIEAVIPMAVNVAGSRLVAWDSANNKLKLFTALSTEAADTSNQSSITALIQVIGV